ncbi:hypothetical protein BV25DRAFT_626207 [Artomyces pyxidatus]|uniref:Uncharacterized protein n=1 Tax=Artomyces pyxidatus TaxID=48021 RepID=A0ACB8T2P4_9AGAM|nr:hypothetical protein BV25DRAFT_626207 [Artomyces pyxidatus]
MSSLPDTPERRLLSLTMSQIISPDAPLSSPISPSDAWDALDLDSFTMPFQAPSPPFSDHSATSSMLKAESYGATESQMCVATSQLFDMPPASPVSPPSSPSMHLFNSPGTAADLMLSPGAPAVKRPSSPTPSSSSAAKKPRGAAGISTKDFVPPDVTGLSKREARLVKNRAAAFLSRQRKREEFENMEVRVAELEQENARLQAIAMQPAGAQRDQQDDQLRSEIDALRAQLAAASQRERALASQLSQSQSHPQLQSPARRPVIKTEPMSPPRFPSQSLARSDASRAGASLSLLVLLCALPSIFSMQATQGGMPMHGSFPLSSAPTHPFSSMDFGSGLSMSDYDWRAPASTMDMDFDMDSDLKHAPHMPSRFGPRKLEFVDTDSMGSGLGLEGLDVAFDTEPAENGKIRVRIYHPSASPASSTPALSPTLSSASTPSLSSSSSSSSGPYALDWTIPATGRKRVRIAMRSMPQAGGGGEWEVEVC